MKAPEMPGPLFAGLIVPLQAGIIFTRRVNNGAPINRRMPRRTLPASRCLRLPLSCRGAAGARKRPTSLFLTSDGIGNGGNLGGLAAPTITARPCAAGRRAKDPRAIS
jgi:hypothetical protein